MTYIQGVDPNQKMMFPEYLEDYITENNSVRIIDAYINTLDLESINFTKINKHGPEPKDIILKYY